MRVFRDAIGETCVDSEPALSPTPGEQCFPDIYYPIEGSGHQHPFLIMVCAMTRFTVSVPIPSMRAEVAIKAFGKHWMMFAGRPRFLIRDSGPGTIAGVWADFCAVWGITLITNPVNTPAQMGMVERSVAIIKMGMRRIKPPAPNMPVETSTRHACVARNNMPLLGPNLTPSLLMFGKSNLFEAVGCGAVVPRILLTDNQAQHQDHMLRLLRTRNEMATWGAERTIKFCLQQNIRPFTGRMIPIGSSAHIGVAGKWEPGWRFWR